MAQWTPAKLKQLLLLLAAGLPLCTIVQAAPIATAAAGKPTVAPPAAQAPNPRALFRRGPVCMCGGGPTERDIEAAQLKRAQTDRASKTP